MTDKKKPAAPRGPTPDGEVYATADETAQGFRVGEFTLPAQNLPGGKVVKPKDVQNFIALDREGRDLGHASLNQARCMELRANALKLRAIAAARRA